MSGFWTSAVDSDAGVISVEMLERAAVEMQRAASMPHQHLVSAGGGMCACGRHFSREAIEQMTRGEA